MNKYLEKIATTRLVKNLAKGLVTTPVKDLVSGGYIRSAARYAKGMRAGVKSLANEAGADITRITKVKSIQAEGVQSGSGYVTTPSRNGKIHIYHDGGKSAGLPSSMNGPEKQVEHQAGLMHEVFEAQSLRKDLSKGIPDTNLADVSVWKTQRDMTRPGADLKILKDRLRFYSQMASPRIRAVTVKNGMPTGYHQSLEVLGKESNMIRKNPHLHHGIHMSSRKTDGEADYLKKLTGKLYGVDKFTKKDLKKLDTASPTRNDAYQDFHDM
jgi:hypothetical protein